MIVVVEKNYEQRTSSENISQKDSMRRFSIDRFIGSGFYHATLLFLLAFLIRSIIAQVQIIAPDGVLYVKIAKDISTGHFTNVDQYGFFNLYSFLIALFQKVFQDWEFSGKMVSILFGSLSIFPLFFLAKAFFNVRVAFFSALVYALHPRFVEISSDVLREPTCWFFAVTALWLAWEGLAGKRYPLFAVSAFSAGLAMVTRLEGAVVFAVIVLWISLALIDGRENRKRLLICFCVFVFSLPVLMSPFVLVLKGKLNRWELGHPVEKMSGLIVADDETERTGSDILKDMPAGYGGFMEIAERHRYTLFGAEVIYKFFKALNIVLVIFLLYGVWRRRFIDYTRKDFMIVLWLAAAFFGLYVYVMKIQYLSSRHALFMVLPTLIWVGAGFVEIHERLKKRYENVKFYRQYSRYDTIFLIFLAAVLLIPQTALSYRHDKTELKKAGIELKRTYLSAKYIIAQPSLNRVAFYAGMEAIQLPREVDEKKLMFFFQEHRNGILLIDERTIDRYAPMVKKIITDKKFEKLPLPAVNRYEKYTFSLYRIRW